jgi:hypothetical protein
MARFDAACRSSLSKGHAKVMENQRVLEGEARAFKTTASNLLGHTAHWSSQYQAFCRDVEVCACVGSLYVYVYVRACVSE